MPGVGDSAAPPPGTQAQEPGKLPVVAPSQTAARRCLQILPGWIPTPLSRTVAQLAISDTPRAHEILAAFRKDAEFSILATVTMAYEGPDAPEAAVVAASTHIRSRVRLERMIARAMRVDPHGGDHDSRRALVFHPDDLRFAGFRVRTWPWCGRSRRRRRSCRRHHRRPNDESVLAGRDGVDPGRSRTRRSGRDCAAGLRVPGSCHRCNAVLEPVTGNSSRAQLGLAEPEAAIGWLERTWIAAYAWIARKRGKWTPPVGRDPRSPNLLAQTTAARGVEGELG